LQCGQNGAQFVSQIRSNPADLRAVSNTSSVFLRSYPVSSSPIRESVFTWRWKCSACRWTPNGKHLRPRRLKAMPSIRCGMKIRWSSNEYVCSDERCSFSIEHFDSNEPYVSGGSSHAGVVKDSRVRRQREVHWPSHHPSMCHPTRQVSA